MGRLITFCCALITGATSGIGEELAKLLKTKGIKIIISGRNLEKLHSLSRQIEAEEFIQADLNEAAGREKVIECIRVRKPDLLINNAGFGLYGDPLTLSIEEQLSLLEVNAKAPLQLTLEAARTLIAAGKKGVILNVSSVAGEIPTPGMSIYGASKAFLTKASQGLHTELAAHGVAVLVSCPGMVSTDFASRAAHKKISIQNSSVMSASYAAEQIWKQIISRKEKCVFNWRYRLGSLFAAYLAPTSLVKNIIWKQIKQRI